MDVMQDAFGLISMVALMPLITIQIIGIIFKKSQSNITNTIEKVSDDEIIVFKRKMITEESITK